MSTKRILLVLGIAGGLGFVAAYGLMNPLLKQERAELARQQAAWQAEKAELEAALEQAKASAGEAVVVAPAPQPSAPARPTPAEIIARLQALRLAAGTGAPSQVRQALYWLEELAQAGPAALPAIRAFLARNEDVEFDTSWLQSKAARDGKLPGDFLLPPSLRLGLLDVVRRIPGPDAETLLADTLAGTGRGLEVAYLTRLLQELAPNKYRNTALAAARGLLAAGTPVSATPLDRYHRDYLYGVLAFYNDASYSTTAQSQIISVDGKVDRSALKYLEQSLGAQAGTIAAQAYADPRLTDPAAKEPFARVALAFVGTDAQANQFYQQAINDPSLLKNHRRELIEDLNREGFVNGKNLTANDLPLIQNRITLIEQLAPSAMDQVNAAAFKEAYKDLLGMRTRITNPPGQPAAPAGNNPQQQ
jgi:hypothetical protein